MTSNPTPDTPRCEGRDCEVAADYEVRSRRGNSGFLCSTCLHTTGITVGSEVYPLATPTPQATCDTHGRPDCEDCYLEAMVGIPPDSPGATGGPYHISWAPIIEAIINYGAANPEDSDDQYEHLIERIQAGLVASYDAGAKRGRQAERDEIAAVLNDAIELAEEGWGYASDYFREKWDYAARLEALKAAAKENPNA